MQVHEGSPAAEAGVCSGDIFIEFMVPQSDSLYVSSIAQV